MHTSVDKVVHPRDVPANRAVTEIPTSLEEIYTLLLARLQPLKEVTEVAVEEQKNFANIILGELAVKWGDFQMQISDPFLSSRENQEVLRLVAVEMVKRSQNLFMSTVSNAVKLLENVDTESQLFSVAANMSRLRAQLTWNISEALSIQRLRSEVIDRVKGMRQKTTDSVKTRVQFSHDASLKELAKITLKPVAKYKRATSPTQAKKRHLSYYAMSRVERRQTILERLPAEDPLAFSILLNCSFLDTVSASRSDLDSNTKHKVHFGTLLSDVVIPKFDPQSLQPEIQESTEPTFSRALSDPTPVPVETSRELSGDLRTISLPSSNVNEEDLLKFDAVMRALHLQGQVDVEGPGEDGAEEEELPPLLCGVVTGRKLPKPIIFDNTEKDTKDEELMEDVRAVSTDKSRSIVQFSVDPPKYEPSNIYSSTYTPSLSRLSPAGDVDIDLHTQTASPDISKQHPLGPDPVNKEGTIEQPGTILIELPGKPLLEVTSLRISDREPLTDVLLKQFEPVFNPLTGEIPQDIADEMDNKLFQGAELKDVYAELQQMISTQHSDIESYSDIVSAPSASEIRLSEGYTANSTLHLPKRNKIINPELVRAKCHPWGEKGRESWLYSNSYEGYKEARRNAQQTSGSSDDGGKRMYNSWRRWWESHLSADDFLMWSSQRDADFLGVIFHVYESEESADESESREEDVAAPSEGKRVVRKFIPGYWNVTEELSAEGTEQTDIQHKKTDQQNILLQEKLFEIWSTLEIPGIAQSEMAIKYGTQMSLYKAMTALDLWLEVAREITRRESVLREVEIFEQTASDPLRFFTGPATAQLDESKQREKLHKRLKTLSNKIKPLLQRLKRDYGDVVTHRGVMYSHKMSRDIVEMLYWLEQERSKIRGSRLQYLWNGYEMPPSLPPLLTTKLN